MVTSSPNKIKLNFVGSFYHKDGVAAEAARLAYEPVTDRGGWLAEVRTIAAERLEAVRSFAQELTQRAAQTWRHWTGQDQEEAPGSDAGRDAPDRLRRGREAAQAGQSAAPASSSAELLQRGRQVAQAGQAGQGQGASGADRLQRAREIAQGQGQVPSRPRDEQGQG